VWRALLTRNHDSCPRLAVYTARGWRLVAPFVPRGGAEAASAEDVAMQPEVAVTEFLYAYEHADKTRRWYALLRQRAPRPRYDVPSAVLMVHGYDRTVRALLNWCVREGQLDERIPRRIAMPRPSLCL
jgi:hypothetical protein